MNSFGHDSKRGFSVGERLQFATDPATARRVREEAKRMKITRGDLIEIAIKQYFEKLDADLAVEKRNEFFKEFESAK